MTLKEHLEVLTRKYTAEQVVGNKARSENFLAHMQLAQLQALIEIGEALERITKNTEVKSRAI